MLFQKLFYRLTKLSFIKVGVKLFAMNFSFNFYFFQKSLNPTKEKIGMWPPSKWVVPFNEEDGIEDDDGIRSVTFKMVIASFMERKV